MGGIFGRQAPLTDEALHYVKQSIAKSVMKMISLQGVRGSEYARRSMLAIIEEGKCKTNQ